MNRNQKIKSVVYIVIAVVGCIAIDILATLSDSVFALYAAIFVWVVPVIVFHIQVVDRLDLYFYYSYFLASDHESYYQGKNIFDEAVDKYHSYAIELPMTVDKAIGAKEPTYAHDTDAAADLYAPADQIVPAHSYGNMIKTGVKIQLPEGWLAMILPRSSMGTKTPLRLSNSVGLIDSGYRGELGILYDNTSNEDYQITAGDRIAQLLVMPSYRFKAKVVDILADSDRGEGGFGASGK